ncbi:MULTISPECIES: SusC/RagA family TonB-linked outer membrane protein [Pedobacter]|uniref:SusC/RagA family TonB-linked outer membrane protein n=1 Tax=Pedobacter TaxID=84567 RepID=UPI002931381B|nr:MULTISPECIES: SusC/RagA family TonB-linked outer membrane protein [Pedobacter]
MKLTTVIMIIGCMHLNAAVFSQNINVSEKSIKLEKLLDALESQSGYTFFYKKALIKSLSVINVELRDATIQQAMDKSLQGLPLYYKIVGNTVVIKPAEVIKVSEIKHIPSAFLGRVTDENDKPMPGVSVRIKESNIATLTNNAGEYTIIVPVPDKQILQFSFVGYETKEISIVGLKNPVLVKLKVSISNLDQVQVLAYGTTSRRTSTGNVYTLKAEDIAKSPSRNVLEIIQGQVPGLFVQQQSGLPGSPFNVLIRGKSTFGDSQPLIVVDGVTYPSGNLPKYYISGGNEGVGSILRGGNALDYIDPSIIESIDILKDADATSIYGSRGAYGVILITTKKGKAGKPVLNVNVSSGLTVRGSSPEMLNTQDYLMLRREALRNDGTNPNPALDLDLTTWPTDRYTDWVKEFSGNYANVNRANASYSGGSENINFLVSGNYRKQNSIQIGSGSTRDGGINVSLGTTTPDKKFSLNVNASYNSTTDDAVPFDFSQGASSTLAPNAPPLFLPNGRLNWETNQNPAAATNIIYKSVSNNLISSAQLSYKPINGLAFNATVGYNNISGKELRAQPSAYYNPSTNYITTSTMNLYTVRTFTVDPNVSYEIALGKGKLSAKTGFTLQDQLTYSNQVTGNNFLSDDMVYNPSFADALTATGQPNITTVYNQTPNKYIGFFGNLNYNWANKYILNVSARYDGSTKFGENKQFGWFGSFGASYIISEEEWFKNALPFVSFAKIRGSYGNQGGDNIPNYGYLTTYSRSGLLYQGNLGLQADALANRELHWERNTKGEVGVSIEFFKGRLYFDATYYRNRASDQLTSQPLSSVTGFNSRLINSPAEVRNTGYEFVLNSKNINGKDFSWATTFNISFQKNNLLAYPGIETAVTNFNYEIGKSINGIKVFNFDGVDPNTGLYNFINRNGVRGTFRPLVDPVSLDPNLDRTEFIDLTPNFFAGLQNTLRYKNISLDFNFSLTSRMGKNFLGSQQFSPGQRNNTSVIALERWQNPGDVTGVPKASAGLGALFSQNNFISSTGAYSDATYLRLNSLSLSYALPTAFLQKIRIKGLNLTLQGSNLFTISKYGDLDPENLGAGMAPLRFFTAGLNLTL